MRKILKTIIMTGALIFGTGVANAAQPTKYWSVYNSNTPDQTHDAQCNPAPDDAFCIVYGNYFTSDLTSQSVITIHRMQYTTSAPINTIPASDGIPCPLHSGIELFRANPDHSFTFLYSVSTGTGPGYNDSGPMNLQLPPKTDLRLVSIFVISYGPGITGAPFSCTTPPGLITVTYTVGAK